MYINIGAFFDEKNFYRNEIIKKTLDGYSEKFPESIS